MYTAKQITKKISVLVFAILVPAVVLLSTLSGCLFDEGPLTEEEVEKKQNSMLLALDNFRFGEYTCSGSNPKFVIEVDSDKPYYVLPSKSEIVVPNTLEYHIYLGEPYLQPLRPSETIDIPEGNVRTITIVFSSEGQEIIVRGMVANLGEDPIPMYVGFPNIEGVQYFDGNHHEIDIKKDVYPNLGDDYKFMIGLDENYSQSILTVKINGEVITPDGDGIYTIYGIKEDTIIEIDGVKHN